MLRGKEGLLVQVLKGYPFTFAGACFQSGERCEMILPGKELNGKIVVLKIFINV